MFQFTTETIVNSNVDSSGAVKFSGTNSTLSVLRAGNFKKAEVISLYKHPATAAVKEVYNATIPTVVVGVTYRLAIDARLSGSANSEWANEYVMRSKLFNYEYTALTTSATDLANAFKAIIAKEMNMTGFAHFVFTNTAGAFTLTASNEYIRFKSVEVQSLNTEVGTTGAILTGYNNYTLLALTSISKTDGAQGFGTVTWLTKNLRLPTIDRTNWTAIGQDELPQAGGTYNQYSIRIATNRGFSGMGAVGATLTSVTTHIFYVLVGAVATAFEAAITAAGIPMLIADAAGLTGTFQLTTTDNVIGVGDFTTITPVGNVGAVTYAVSDAAKFATVNAATGLTSVALAAGANTVTATDAAGNTGTIVITVIA